MLHLVSRRNKPLRFPGLISDLERLPEGTVLDGEVVALDETGRPSFNRLQNYRKGVEIHYFVFDLLFHDHMRVTDLALSEGGSACAMCFAGQANGSGIQKHSRPRQR